MMAPSSCAEWVQTAIQFFAFIGVGLYTWITYRMAREMKAQNQAIQEQLRLQREELKHQRQLADEASHPIVEWSPIQSNFKKDPNNYHLDFICRGNAMQNIEVRSPITGTSSAAPSDYLDVGQKCVLMFRVPLTVLEGTETLRFTLTYGTKTGFRGQMDFEIAGLGTPRKLYQGPVR